MINNTAETVFYSKKVQSADNWIHRNDFNITDIVNQPLVTIVIILSKKLNNKIVVLPETYTH